MSTELPASSAPEIPSTPTPEVRWQDRQKSEALLKWEREVLIPQQQRDMLEIDDRLNQHLGSREYVDAYGNQKAKALDAMKKYINRAYLVCAAEAHKSDTNAAEKAQWSKFFNKCTEDVRQYSFLVTALIIEAAHKNDEKAGGKGKGKIDLVALFDLAERGQEIFENIAKEPKYGDIIKKLSLGAPPPDKLEDTDYDFIINKFPPRAPGPISADDSMKLLEASGATSILYMMSLKQRMAFAEYIIDRTPANPEQTVGIITSLASSGYLTNGQLEGGENGGKLYEKMKTKGLISEAKQHEIEATVKIGQAKAATIRKNIDTSVHADMDKNLAIKFFEPRYIGGLALMVWRGTNMALSLVAYRNDLTEYAKSPWLIADIAGILGGSALLGNPSILEWIKSDPNAKTLEQQANMIAMCQMITDKSAITEKYFTKPMKGKDQTKEAGMVELITIIRERKEEKHEKMHITIDDMIDTAEGKDPKIKEKMKTKPVTPELLALLKAAKTAGDQAVLEQYASVIASVKSIRDTRAFNNKVDELKSIQGIK